MMVLDRLMVFTQQVPRRAPLVFRLGRWRWPVLLLVTVVLLLLVVVPVGNLLYQVGLVVHQVDGVPVSQLVAGTMSGVAGALAVDLSVCGRVGVSTSAVAGRWSLA